MLNERSDDSNSPEMSASPSTSAEPLEDSIEVSKSKLSHAPKGSSGGVTVMWSKNNSEACRACSTSAFARLRINTDGESDELKRSLLEDGDPEEDPMDALWL